MIRSNSRENITNEDIFWRSDFTEKICTIVETWKENWCTFSLNWWWWEWKTTYLKSSLIPELKNLDKTVIYINTFEKDYINDPLLLISWEISESTYWNDGSREEFKKQASILFKLIWKVWIRYLLRWDIPEIDDRVESSIEDSISEYVWNSLEVFKQEKDAIEKLKLLIKNFVESWNKPLTIIVDEIDRCRPEFAIKILETIKHFFDIDWVVFIISMNKTQIKSYIEKIYWTNISEIYLQKFLDFEVNLEKKVYQYGNNWHMRKYILHVFNSQDIIDTKECMLLFARYIEFNYREINILFNECTICKKFDTAGWFSPLILFFLTLKLKHPLIFRNFTQKKFEGYNIIETLWLHNVSNDDEDYYLIERFSTMLESDKKTDYLANLAGSLSEL